MEQQRPATRVPAEQPSVPRRRPRRDAQARAGGPQVPPAVAAGAATAWARARLWTANAVARTRSGVSAVATSPRTQNAKATGRDYWQRGMSASADRTRRFSAYAREQFERDPQRAWVATAAIAAGILVVIVALAMLIGSVGGGAEEGDSAAGDATGPAVTQPAGASAPAATEEASPTPAATETPAPLAGVPYSESTVANALRTRGLNAALVDDAFVCQNASTTPRTYRVTGAGAEQRAVLLVYPDSATMNTDWIIGGGRPQYRNGSCGADADVIYFNANLLLVFPQTTSTILQAQMVDAFLTLP